MSPIRVGLLGTGFSATVFHLPYITSLPELFTLHSIYERNSTPETSTFRPLYGPKGVKVVGTPEEVINDPEVQLVVISLKDWLHYQYAKAALLAGKHIVVEKPVMALSSQVAELNQIAKSKHLVFAPYHNRRFDGDFRTVKALIESGKLPVGDLVDFESRYDCRATWPLGDPVPTSGMLYGLGTHLIDQTVVLFGAPKSVTCFMDNGRREGNPAIDDMYTLILRYANLPVVVTVKSALHSVMEHQIRYVVRTKEASYVKYGLDPQEAQAMFQGMKPTETGFGWEEESAWGTYAHTGPDGKPVYEKLRTMQGSYLDYYKTVAGAINGTGRLEVTPEQAELGVRIIERGKESAREGRTVAF